MLIVEALHYEVPKGYIYFAVGFSLLVEVLNMRFRKSRNPVQLRGQRNVDSTAKVEEPVNH